MSNTTQKDLQDTKDRLFFVVGTSRSGSTLLQSMLSSHSNIVIPPETHFFYSSQMVMRKYRYQFRGKEEEFRKRLIDFWYLNKTRIRDLGLSRDEVAECADQLSINHPYDLFTLQLTIYRKQREKEIVGEKTPRHILYVKEILETYPKAKIISLFRDPRAASYSEIKAHFGSPSVIVTTRRWRKYVEVHEEMSEKLSDRQYKMIRYTDLIQSPGKILNEICEFLGVSFEEQMMEYYDRNETGFAEGEAEWKKGTLKPIQKDKNKEWKDALNDWQIALIEDIAGEYMERLDYRERDIKLSFPEKLFYEWLDYSRSVWATLSRARDEGYKNPKLFNW